jgi:hypothetical protein
VRNYEEISEKFEQCPELLHSEAISNEDFEQFSENFGSTLSSTISP